MVDPRAKQILFDTYWSKTGWTDGNQRTTSPADLRYAKSQGIMFDPFQGDHAEVVERTMRAIKALEPRLADVTGAFLASLSTRWLELRSGAASYLIAFNTAKHTFTSSDASPWCDICGACESYRNEDLNVLNFERFKWGGVRLRNALYRMLDLEQLVARASVTPTADDISIFNKILDAIAHAPARDTAPKLSERLTGLFPSTKNERKRLIEILAASFVLVASKEYDRQSEWDWAADWRGADRYNRKQVIALFGMHGIRPKKLATTR